MLTRPPTETVLVVGCVSQTETQGKRGIDMIDTTTLAVHSAVADLAEVWGQSIPYESDTAFAGMTCDEAEALAQVFRAIGRDDHAAMLIDSHALGDNEEEDDHHDKYLEIEREDGAREFHIGL